MPATILVVEDEGDIAILLRYNLEAEGFRVVTAETGDEAQHAIQEKLPDLILLDWMMPLMDGREVVERLDQEQPDSGIEIIVISGQPAPSVLPARVRSWLTKPLTVDELVSEIGRDRSEHKAAAVTTLAEEH